LQGRWADSLLLNEWAIGDQADVALFARNYADIPQQ